MLILPISLYDLLRVMRERANVCKYLDIALQHISDPMLTKMRRNITKEETYALLERIREEVPGIHIRTTLMVSHPGETEQDFEELVEFVKRHVSNVWVLLPIAMKRVPIHSKLYG